MCNAGEVCKSQQEASGTEDAVSMSLLLPLPSLPLWRLRPSSGAGLGLMTGPCCPDQPLPVHAVSALGLVFLRYLYFKSVLCGMEPSAPVLWEGRREAGFGACFQPWGCCRFLL